MKQIDFKTYQVPDSVVIKFEGKSRQVSSREIKELKSSDVIYKFVSDLGLKNFIVLDQTHSFDGICVEDIILRHSDKGRDPISFQSSFEYQGDFIITNQKDCAIIALTADCVPIVLYDFKNHAIGVVHSGWKGSAFQVTEHAILAMQKKYGSDISGIQVFFGPSAGPCCYQVTEEFLNHFSKFEYACAAFSSKNGKTYFDNQLFLVLGLKKFGIKPEKIYTNKEICTICSEQFCSARREKNDAGRQITLAFLR